MLVSGVQQSDSVIHIHMSILFQVLFPFRLLKNIEQSSLSSLLLIICFKYSSAYRSVPEKAMAPHSSTLAWKIPWMEEPGRLQSMGSLRVGHD